MPEYEIRVLDDEGCEASIVLEQSYNNDEAAIGAAFQVANGAAFEVWRDLYCICSKSCG